MNLCKDLITERLAGNTIQGDSFQKIDLSDTVVGEFGRIERESGITALRLGGIRTGREVCAFRFICLPKEKEEDQNAREGSESLYD